jgi:hypothetical protein
MMGCFLLGCWAVGDAALSAYFGWFASGLLVGLVVGLIDRFREVTSVYR